jgi:hypothetical protein
VRPWNLTVPVEIVVCVVYFFGWFAIAGCLLSSVVLISLCPCWNGWAVNTPEICTAPHVVVFICWSGMHSADNSLVCVPLTWFLKYCSPISQNNLGMTFSREHPHASILCAPINM